MCIHIFQNDLSNIITTYLHFFKLISIPCLQNISIFTDCFQIIISQINKYKSLWKLLHVHWRKVFKKKKQKQKVVPSPYPLPLPQCTSTSPATMKYLKYLQWNTYNEIPDTANSIKCSGIQIIWMQVHVYTIRKRTHNIITGEKYL